MGRKIASLPCSVVRCKFVELKQAIEEIHWRRELKIYLIALLTRTLLAHRPFHIYQMKTSKASDLDSSQDSERHQGNMENEQATDIISG